MGDAIVRTLVRMYATRRNLLEWTTAAQAKASHDLGLAGFYRQMAGGVALAAVTAVLVLAVEAGRGVGRPAVRRAVAAVARHRAMGQPPAARIGGGWTPAADARHSPSHGPPDLAVLRDLRRTGRPRAAAGQLPGRPGAGRRASHVADEHRDVPARDGHGARLRLDRHAGDGGATGVDARDDRRPRALPWAPVQLVRHAGPLRQLDPAYISSVDSGNLAGHLLALSNACRQMIDQPLPVAAAQAGIGDAIALTREVAGAIGDDRRGQTVTRRQLDEALDRARGHRRRDPRDSRGLGRPSRCAGGARRDPVGRGRGPHRRAWRWRGWRAGDLGERGPPRREQPRTGPRAAPAAAAGDGFPDARRAR